MTLCSFNGLSDYKRRYACYSVIKLILPRAERDRISCNVFARANILWISSCFMRAVQDRYYYYINEQIENCLEAEKNFDKKKKTKNQYCKCCPD